MFDDGLHSALKPFEFYASFLEKYGEDVDYVFIEVFGITCQPALDAFFAAEVKDSTLLMEAFQNDYSGLGWRYETYWDLLSTIWDINNKIIKGNAKKIKVIGVDQPIYWEAIHSREDYDIFQKTLVGWDYFMYKTILKYMDNFESDKKGILLTNTRHAYKHIRNKEGQPFWNCGTFFNQWHPGKTYAIRIHNATLSIEAEKKEVKNGSTQGLDRIKYRWVKMEDGLWDDAFKLNGNVPVAFSLDNNVFGAAKYMGNHMLKAAEGQTMFDAYDALIFLAPFDRWHFSSKMDFIYTEKFKKELIRRITLLNKNRMEEFLAENEVESVEEFIKELSKYHPVKQNTLLMND